MTHEVVLEPRCHVGWPDPESVIWVVAATDFDGRSHLGAGRTPHAAVADWCQQAGFPSPPAPPGATFRRCTIVRHRVTVSPHCPN